MNKVNILAVIAAVILLNVTVGRAQSSAYFQAVTNLNPVGYWPMHEIEGTAPGGPVETNYGTLGALGNAFLGTWAGDGGITNNITGALTGDADTAMSFDGVAPSYLLVPQTATPLLVPPFTIECWAMPFGGLGDIIGDRGATLNFGGSASSKVGVALTFGKAIPTPLQAQIGNGTGNKSVTTGQTTDPGTWSYIVLTCDANTNFTVYFNGSAIDLGYYPYAPCTWNPLTIGGSYWYQSGPYRRLKGAVDEVAVYTNALDASRILAHYDAGTDPATYGAYETNVLADNPLLYYHMDAPSYTPPDTSSWPVLTNYGSVAINGVYSPGSMPGAVPGPFNLDGVPFGGLSGAKTALGNGMSSFANVGNSPAFNVPAGVPFSVAAMFQGNPTDNRVQSIVGHGAKSWQIVLTTTGLIECNSGNGPVTGVTANDLISTGVYNDGNWHQLVYTYDGTNTESLYVDGALDNSGTSASYTNGIGSTEDVLIGADPDFTNNPPGIGRQFAGQVCEVAFWNGTALSAAQIREIYSAAGVAPQITQQPAVANIRLGGQTNVLNVFANGSDPLAYQWFFNTTSNYTGASALSDGVTGSGSMASGATTATLTVADLQDGDSGYYFAVVTNNYGSETSALSELTVFTAPVITAQVPTGDFTLYGNQNYTLSVTVKGAKPLSYHWLTNGVADTTTGSNSTYALRAVQTTMSGRTFQCIITNMEGAVTNTLVTLTVLPGPTTAYATNVMNLNPVAYWPMQETDVPAPSDIETNWGSLGLVANAYYVDTQGSSLVGRGIPGALAGDSDPAASFSGQPNCYIAAPATSGSLAQAPFTIELWAWPQGTSFTMPVGKSAYEALNGGGNPGAGNGVPGGWTVDWSRQSGKWDMQMFGNGPHTGTGNATYIYGTTAAASTTNWQHVVFTFDGTNVTFYWNGQMITSQPAKYPYLPDIWDPLTIGAGRIADNAGGDPGGHRYTGYLDEVALYSNVLSPIDILAHYQAGTNTAPATSYETLVMDDHPIAYYRLDAPAYTPPPANEDPALINYGLLGVSGRYPPNTVPGGVPGPFYVKPGMLGVASPINGLNAAAEAGYAPALNPTGNQPLTALVWVKGNPTDTRFQSPIGRGDTSWRFGWDNHGKAHWNAGAGGEITSVKVVNDGNWHFLAGVYDGSTNYLYIDGALDSVSAATGTIAGNTNDVYLGGAPDYTASGNERYFAGSLCEAAFFTNALGAAQVQQLYSVAGRTPQITQQPVAATANQGGAYTNTVTASGTPALFYQWYRNGAAISGQTNANLVYKPVQIADAGTNFVVITNVYGAVTSSAVTLTVIATPIITVDPTSVTMTNNILLFVGAHPTFTVAAAGAVPLSYQWYSNDVAVAGARATTYTLPPLQLDDQTNFYCVVTNVLGQTTSSVVTVTALATPTATYPQAVLAANPVGYWRLNEPEQGNGDAGVIADDYWGAYNGIYTNVTLGASGYNQATDPNTTAATFGFNTFVDGDVFGIGGIDFATPDYASAEFSVEAWVDGYSQTHDAAIVSKESYGNGGEEFCLDVHNDVFRFFVRNASGAAFGATSTISPDPTAQIWHHLVGVCDEVNGFVSLYVDGTLAASASVPPDSGISALAADSPIVIGSRVSGATPPNDDQFVGYLNDVAIYNYALSASQIASQYFSAGIAPRITQDPPAIVDVNENGTVSVPAAAAGTPMLSYQWYNQNTGLPFAGQTNATLVLSNVTMALSGASVYLHVENAYGNADSSSATLTLISGPPQIASAALPPHIFVYSNSVYPYTVTVTGTEPFVYQWYNGNGPIAGATNESYSFLAQTSTTISVVITNVQGAVTSNPSLVTIITAPTNAYAQAVLALDPVGYWPMQETNTPTMGDIETNYGSLGPLANAYYVDTQNNPVNRGVGGALAGDSDPAASFNGGKNNYMATPAISTNLALRPPFTVEFWAWPQDTSFGMPVAKNGFEGLNAGGETGAGTGNLCGWSVDWARNGVPQWDFQLYHDVAAQGNAIQIFGPNLGSVPSGWEHLVFTYDGTTLRFYMNGHFVTSGTAPYVPDLWSPLCVGGGRLGQNTLGTGGYRLFNGKLDEVALYTNVLSDADILLHYQVGTNSSSATPYFELVTNDNPLVYYRMDAPYYTPPALDTYPPLVNYGSSSVVGNYPPNTVPGLTPGPTALGTNLVASPINGLNAAVDAGFAPAFNPTTGQPMTAMVWMKGYPADNRVQTIMGRGDQSWSFKLDLNGKVHWASGENGGEITSSEIANDGQWHFLTGVYDGSENYLYVDGALDGTAAATGPITGDSSDVLLGGTPDYTGTTNEQYFAGSLCEAAFFTNALTAEQIQQVYIAASSSGSVPTLGIARSGSNFVITWDVGTLLSSANVAGPYNPVSGASSPYTNAPSAGQIFYRVSNP